MVQINYFPDDEFNPRMEAVAAHEHVEEPYYRFKLPDLCVYLSDAQRQQLIQVLVDAPPLPKTDAQIDAEREAAQEEYEASYAGMAERCPARE